MKLLHNIGTFKHSNYNTREQVMDCREQLSFDGVYLNVWENKDLLLNRELPTILFIMGDYVGKDNSFDIHNGLPLERYCDVKHIVDLLVNYHCVLGWHSRTHRDLTTLSNDEVIKEVLPDFYATLGDIEGGSQLKWHKPKYFAYPYGCVDKRVADIVKESGHYQAAYSVNQGDGSQFQINRTYL